jgi:Zn-dependent protease
MSPDVLITIASFVAFIYSIIAHEVAHGWVALKCGDPTAHHQGRLTANPIPHIDPMMSVIVPLATYFAGGFLFGAAKPVPVNLSNLRRWPRDHILVALAGVTVNLAIALFCAGVLHVLYRVGRTNTIAWPVMARTMVTNIGLMVFNLVPIPPLDGSRVFRYLLPYDVRWKYDRLEPYGFIIIIVVMQLPLFSYILGTIEGAIIQLIAPHG